MMLVNGWWMHWGGSNRDSHLIVLFMANSHNNRQAYLYTWQIRFKCCISHDTIFYYPVWILHFWWSNQIILCKACSVMTCPSQLKIEGPIKCTQLISISKNCNFLWQADSLKIHFGLWTIVTVPYNYQSSWTKMQWILIDGFAIF